MSTKMFAAVVSALSALALVAAETHTVNFYNNCGYGTPVLRSQSGEVLSQGEDYTSDGALDGAIAYLQTGGCGGNGEGCTLVELTLTNGWSSADISLISPHEFSVTSGFGYWNGCDNTGTDCSSTDCGQAFHNSDDNVVQVGCSADDVNLAITFCD
ncbi:uncharacterized protein B0H18DRAFT_520828 [Fomitopsis serialis]|uniref:uncharacterized protein n=1 Tax=Fomitopsis serialis TaxID=139415 RepID=UPI0020080304|nr:uncharacterized protein B0H18DRAFT_520828 [Neoantrodia serialis]KAH9910140.1 hypothetical protein B0H18DRAFT_520828 [Neoantrodia serialis]